MGSALTLGKERNLKSPEFLKRMANKSQGRNETGADGLTADNGCGVRM